MKNSSAAIAWPRGVAGTPTRRNSAPVSGHAESPEQSAYHPFVSGHGPRVHSSQSPPPPARTHHAQPASHHSLPDVVMERTTTRRAPRLQRSSSFAIVCSCMLDVPS